MRLEQAARPMFAYHQTFHPRFGWLKKGFTAAAEDPGVFLADDATVRLGVGKNMVSAIRFWSTAFHVLDRVPHPTVKRAQVSVPTPLGLTLLDDESGYDPYFEDPATLWVLHWQLVSSLTDVPVWWSTFNDLTSIEFTEDQLLQFVSDEVAASSWDTPSPASIKKDVDCLLHMYVPRAARGRQGFDDVVDSPFRELNIITTSPGASGNYRFNLGPKPGATPEIIVYACFDYLARNEPDARTATLTHLFADPGTPGRLLKLTEDAMLEAFVSVAESQPGIALTSPAGAPQLAFDANPGDLAANVLFQHYAKRQPNLSKNSLPVAGTSARIEVTPTPEASVRAPTELNRRKASARSQVKESDS